MLHLLARTQLGLSTNGVSSQTQTLK